MQSEVPSLPVVCSNKHARSSRNQNTESIHVSKENKSNPACNSGTHLLTKKKSFHPMLVDSPYRNSARFYPLPRSTKSTTSTIGQRVMSAKMLRVKQLQNQLTDAHYHLNELSNENKLLKAIQKKQESALKRYEGANAELPRIINSHHEELRILQVKHRRLKEQHKNTSDILKEKEKELHSIQALNKRLLQLSQDRNLGEREKLQLQVIDLNHQIEQQHETILTLNKKLALESKSLKQQINSEMSKHRETQRHLQETMDKLRSLEDLLDNREKRLYYNNQLNVFSSRGKSTGNHSLSNFGESGVSIHFSKSVSKKLDVETINKVLPTLDTFEVSNDRKGSGKNSQNGTDSSASDQFVPKTETMASLQNIRKFRLPKPGSRSRSGSASSKPSDLIDDSEIMSRLEKSKENGPTNYIREQDQFGQNERRDDENLPKTIIEGFEIAEIDANEESNDEDMGNLHSDALAKKSRELHARLTYGSIENTKVLTESLRVKRNQRLLYDDVEKMVQDELKLGQESVMSEELLASIDLPRSYSSLEEESDVDSDGKSDTRSQHFKLPSSQFANNQNNIRKKVIKPDELTLDFNEYGLSPSSTISHGYENETEKRPASNDTDISNSPIIRENTVNSEKYQNFILNDSKKTNERDFDVSSNPIFNGTHFDEADKSQSLIEENHINNDITKSREKLDIYLEAKQLESELTGGDNDFSSKIRRNSLDKKVPAMVQNSEQMESTKQVGYNKEKLLAVMKAIDNNDNIEYLDQKLRRNSASNINRSQITENLFRGIPTHSKRNDDAINCRLADGKMDGKAKASCGKLH